MAICEKCHALLTEGGESDKRHARCEGASSVKWRSRDVVLQSGVLLNLRDVLIRTPVEHHLKVLHQATRQQRMFSDVFTAVVRVGVRVVTHGEEALAACDAELAALEAS